MGPIEIAQQALDKAKGLTFGADQQKVIAAFQAAGFAVSPTGQVTRAPANPPAAFVQVYKALTSLPVAKLGMKRVMGANGIDV